VTPTQVPKPTPTLAIHYPPKTLADLRGLAALGNANAITPLHSESVGLTGVCPQPKTSVTISPNITGKQLAEDLLAYFFGNQMDSACGSVLFAYHTHAEYNAGNGYTAGRVLLNTNNNGGPNATGVHYTLYLDLGDVLSGQEYVVNWTK
jgi:hypothetical protein